MASNIIRRVADCYFWHDRSQLFPYLFKFISANRSGGFWVQGDIVIMSSLLGLFHGCQH